MPDFQLISDFRPTGDQSQAIAKLVEGVRKGYQHQTLLGVTGSGKTFTMAVVVEQVQRPAALGAQFPHLVEEDYPLPGLRLQSLPLQYGRSSGS